MTRLLLKKQLTEIFRSYFYDAKKNKARSKAATIAYIAMFAVLMVVVLGGIFTLLSVKRCAPMAQAGMGWLYFALMGLLAVFLGVFGSVFNTYSGLYLAKDNDVKVIECNLRASRSFPFVSKVLKKNFIETATRIMLGEQIEPVDTSTFDIDYVGVKASQFSFARLHKADPVLGVDMSSTGEVGCLGRDFDEALLNAMISVGHHVPKGAILVSSGDVRGKVDMLEACRLLFEAGYKIYATAGTARFLNDNDVTAIPVSWPDEQGDINVLDIISSHEVDLVINIPKNHTKRELTNGYRIRRWTIDHNIPLLTNARLAVAYVKAFLAKPISEIPITPWQEY